MRICITLPTLLVTYIEIWLGDSRDSRDSREPLDWKIKENPTILEILELPPVTVQ